MTNGSGGMILKLHVEAIKPQKKHLNLVQFWKQSKTKNKFGPRPPKIEENSEEYENIYLGFLGFINWPEMIKTTNYIKEITK